MAATTAAPSSSLSSTLPSGSSSAAAAVLVTNLLFEVVPSKGLGPFRLGMNLRSLLRLLKAERDVYKGVQIRYCDQDPLATDITIHVPEVGLLFSICPSTQELHTIELYDLSKIQLQYTGTTFSSSQTAASFVRVYNLFGPTYPGKYDSSSNSYLLGYPGLRLAFPIPPQFQDKYLKSANDLPLEFPDGTTPVCSRLAIYDGPVDRPTPPEKTEQGEYCHDIVLVNPASGVTLTRGRSTLSFYSSVQDVLSEIGEPSRIFYKEEDKLRIHSTEGIHADNGCADYFFNYFELGLDILFDASKHTVKKIILHTNPPGHYEFNEYTKCLFEMKIPHASTSTSSSRVITADTKWDEVLALAEGGPSDRPVVFQRGSSRHPFGTTVFFGLHGVIFEVMGNGVLCSVTLYPPLPS